MVKKTIIPILIITLLMIIPIVAATDLVVRAKPYESMIVRVLSSGTEQTIASIYPKTNVSGFVITNFSVTSAEVDLKVLVIKAGEIIRAKEFEKQSTSSRISIDVRPDEDIEEEAAVLEAEQAAKDAEIAAAAAEAAAAEAATAEEEKGSSFLTGAAITNLEDIDIPNWIYYSVGGLLLVGIIGFVIAKRAPMRAAKLGQISEGQAEKEIGRAEAKIKAAQKEINVVKNQEKIKKMEDKMQKEKEKLQRLQDGEDEEEEEEKQDTEE
tara:strand:- start:64 stop:864 length:801 start_codon:yes stop_codon:yes gene_type:complete